MKVSKEMVTKVSLFVSWIIAVSCLVSYCGLSMQYAKEKTEIERLTQHIYYLERSAPKAVVDALNAIPGPASRDKTEWGPVIDIQKKK